MNEEQFIAAAEGWLELGDEEAAARELQSLSPEAWEQPAVLAICLRVYLMQADDGGAMEMANRLLDHSPDLIWPGSSRGWERWKPQRRGCSRLSNWIRQRRCGGSSASLLIWTSSG